MKFFTSKIFTITLVLLSLAAKSQVPNLSSFTTGAPTIFLDFDGQRVQHAAWQSGVAFDCAPAALSNTQIIEIFNRVSEDYRPFAVNITTDSTVFLAAPVARRIRVIVTPTSAWYPNAGGISYLGCFNWGDDVPAFVFSDKLNNSSKNIGECCTHESGHSVGLSHQSRYDANCALVEHYNTGIGTGETSWAPVMGNSYYRNMTGWTDGPTPSGCTSAQDNLSIITTQNGFTYRTDDYTDVMDSITTTINPANCNVSGIITTPTDNDAFKFIMPQDGTIHIEATPYSVGANDNGANLDVMILLYDNANTLLKTYNSLTTMQAVIDTTLNSGTYYILVKGAGNNNATNYGSLGSYTLTSALGVLAIHNVSLQGSKIGQSHMLRWNIVADEPIVSQVLETSANGIQFSLLTNVATAIKNYENASLKTANVFYRIKATTTIGESMYSNIIALKGNDKLFTVSTIANQTIQITATDNYSYKLFDVNARLVAFGKEKIGVSSINVAKFSNGMYILQILNNNTIQTERIIKQ